MEDRIVFVVFGGGREGTARTYGTFHTKPDALERISGLREALPRTKFRIATLQGYDVKLHKILP